ncbi:MAG: hypothetical protein H6623_08930 [Bdellovibrionaceae bacterium]|nr:hypothetical protein [Pseudobdellovibrionaceae bacterium]
MIRIYNFISGDEPELEWSPLIETLPRNVRALSRNHNYDCIVDMSRPANKVTERIIFFSDHGNSCHLYCDPNPHISQIIKLLINRLPAERFFIHFSACELLNPACSKLSEIISVDRRICAVSGYSNSIYLDSAAKIDFMLLKRLYRTTEISYSSLLALKTNLFSDIPSHLRSTGFQLYLN